MHTISRRAMRRAGLRALNGAALGMLLGGVLGAALGGVFAHFVVQAAGIGALYGAPPGWFAGALIGMTLVVREPRRALLAGVAAGGAVSFLYVRLLAGIALSYDGFRSPVAVSILASGLIGGTLLSLLLRWIRRRWPWWTRWEDH